jgi:chromosome segregation ATPase
MIRQENHPMKEKERFEVLLEHMDRKIDLVLEGHQVLNRKIDSGLEEARVDREGIKQHMSLLASGLSSRIDLNREEITKNREEIAKNREEIAKNREEITKNREEITKNRTGISQVDRKVEINLAKIEGVDAKISSVRRNYEDHEDRIKILEAVK